MMRWVRYKRTAFALVLALLMAAPWCAALSEDGDVDEVLYMENEWNYVEGSMDISAGIPEDAEGVLADIRERGVLRVATEPYFPPQEFIDPSREGQDRYVGADMEMARLIAERMGVVLEIVPMDFSAVLDSVAGGECDLAISALSFTPGRAARVTMSKGYYYAEDNAGSGLLIRAADAEAIRGVKDLDGRNIVAQSGSLQEALMMGHVLNYREFRRLGSMQEVYDFLAEGKADAAMVDLGSARDYLNNNPDSGLMLVPGVRFTQEERFQGDRVAARKGETQLIAFVNGVIDELLASGQYMTWYRESVALAARLGL